MRHVFRWVKYGLLVLVLGLVGVVGWGAYLLQQPPKALLEKNIKKYSGYTAEIEGTPTLALWPQLVLDVPKLTIQAFSGNKPLFMGEGLHLKLATWLDMFSGGLEIDEIYATRVEAMLHQPKTGLPNWQSPYRRGGGSGGAVVIPPVRDINLQNVNVVYQDDVLGKTHALTDMQVQLGGADLAALTLALNGTYNGQQVQLDGQVDIRDEANMPLTLNLVVPHVKAVLNGRVLDNSRWVGQVAVTSADAAKALKTYLPQAELGVNLTGALSFMSQVDAGAENVSLQEMALTLGDKVALTGVLSVQPPAGNLKVDTTFQRLNLDGLGLCDTKSTRTGKNTDAPWTDAPLDLAVLTDWAMHIDAVVQNMTCTGVPVNGLQLALKGDKNSLKLNKLSLNFPKNGKMQIQAETGVRNGLDGQLTVTLTQLPLEAFLSGSLQQKTVLPLDGTINLTFNGATTRQLAQSLAGAVAIEAHSGQLPGAALASLALSLEKTITGVVSNDAQVDELLLTYAIVDGVAKTEKVSLRTANGQINLTATGKIDLPSWTLYHRVEPVVTASTTFKIPVIIKGNLSSPSVQPEMLNIQNLATGAGAVVGGPVGAAAGAFLGKVLGGQNASATAAGATSATVDQVMDPLKNLLKGL